MLLSYEAELLNLPFKHPAFTTQFWRTLGYTYAKCADIGECFSAAKDVIDGDPESWHSAWSRLALRVEKIGSDSVAKRHLLSARDAYLRAHEYFRQSAYFLRDQVEDPRFQNLTGKIQNCFNKALENFPNPARKVEIPLEDGSLPAYLFLASPAKDPKPTLIHLHGYDHWAEEAYAMAGVPSLERGYHFLSLDIPGQDRIMKEKARTLRPDFEQVLGPVLTWLSARREVNPKQILLLGRGMGSYLAARAASSESRIAGLVLDPGIDNLQEITLRKLPQPLRTLLENQDRKGVNEFMEKGFAGEDFFRIHWLSQAKAHGQENMFDYFNELGRFQLDGLAEKITCPTLVADNPNDPDSVNVLSFYETLQCKKKLVSFIPREGAGSLQEAGAHATFNQNIFDWIDDLIKNLS